MISKLLFACGLIALLISVPMNDLGAAPAPVPAAECGGTCTLDSTCIPKSKFCIGTAKNCGCAAIQSCACG